jgi:predicted GNAT family acetyltransferase
MIVAAKKVDQEHWSTDWIPISYGTILTKNQLNKSYTFLWSEQFEVYALTRAYFISPTRVEIGDVWLTESCRGAILDGQKVSVTFMKRVIAKVWKLFPRANTISLVVSAENIAAITLYQRLGFTVAKRDVKRPQLGVQDGLSMIRQKR